MSERNQVIIDIGYYTGEYTYKIDFIPDSHSILISIFYEYVREHGNL